jgi:hypothetical protein
LIAPLSIRVSRVISHSVSPVVGGLLTHGPGPRRMCSRVLSAIKKAASPSSDAIGTSPTSHCLASLFLLAMAPHTTP